MKNSKRFGICALALTLILLAAAAGATAWIDPYFHYHAPLDRFQYPLYSQRYQNDGIVRHFDYEALITGTSLTENFKASEFEELFGAKTIKVTYSGGEYSEITANVLQALEHNPGIRYVLYGIDEWFLFAGRDLILADGEYPTYLYDDDPFNDVKYLLNKEILLNDTLEVPYYTRQGGTTTSFDDYSSWEIPTGRQRVLDGFTRVERVQEQQPFDKQKAEKVSGHIRQNLISMARENPDTQFLYFFPPYSILNWDAHNRMGDLESTVQAFSLAAQLLMEEPNIQVYSFYTDFETITNLDNYRDSVHYGSHINSLLLQRMARQEYRLTPETNDDHWQQVLEFYRNYDYDAIFEE